MLGCLREFHPWLMLDDVEDLAASRVKAKVSSIFIVVGEGSSL